MSKRWLFFLLPAALLAAAGCRSSAPKPPDMKLACEALEAALEGWKRGDAEIKLGDKAVALRDRDRKAGVKLVTYKLGDTEQTSYDFRCQVTLHLSGAGNRPITRNATYSVITQPSLVVSRVDDE